MGEREETPMSTGAAPRRPNVLIITCHDIGDYWGCYGTPVRTPHIDALAAEGVLFERHFSTATVCSPSRGSITTGCYPPTNGLTGNVHRGDEIDLARCPTLAMLLARAGYETHLFGFQHEHWDARRLGYGEVHQGASRHVDDVAPLFAEWLGGRPAGAGPFLAAMGFTETHRNGMAPSGFTYAHYRPADPAEVEVRPFLPDIPSVRRELADFYGAIALVDEGLGTVLEAIDAAGLREDTVVVFTSDHGASFLHSKATLLDGGVKVGLLMRYPRALPAGRRVRALTSHVDILPTLFALLGIATPAHVQGRSALPQIWGTDEAGREYVFGGRDYGARMARSERFKYIRHLTAHCTYDVGMREIILCPAGLWQNQEVFDHYEAQRGIEELYDLERDPAELHNLTLNAEDRAAYAEPLARMRAALDAHLERTGDEFAGLYVPPGLQPPERAWEAVREAQRRRDPNLAAVVALGEV